MIDLGTVRPGTTIYIPFQTYDSNDPSASVTITGLAVTDIEVYKDGGTTQRASDVGYALLDTDGIDFDTITGIHGVSIDLADNTTAGFWASGSQYWVVIASITVDAATINFIPVTFRIGYPDAVINTTIATLASQTSFTLTSGPAENDALNGCVVCIHDVASAVQLGFGVISDYVGSTKTVTLTAGVSFTAAATDNIAIYPPSNSRWFGQTAQVGDGTTLTEAGGDGDHLTEAGGTGDQLTAVPWNASWDAEVQSECDDALVAFFTSAANLVDLIWDEAQAGHVGAGTFGEIATEIASILADTNELQTDDVPGLIAALNDLSAAAVNAEVVDALATDTYAEPGQGTPAATATLVAKIGYLYKAWRNRSTQTATTYSLYNDDATTVDQKATVSDDATTADKGEIATGP